MKYGPTRLRHLSDLFDAAMEVPLEQRENWLQQLPDAGLRGALQAMLHRHVVDGSAALLTAGQAVLGPGTSGAQEPGDCVGPYRLVRLLGRGGMGDVWLAEQADGRIHRNVALKLPRLALSDSVLRAHFERERDILSTLDHPSIAKLFDAGVTPQGQPFLALQYVPGEALTQYCDGHRLPLAERVQLFLDLVEAVQHAHSALVVHRDIKPSNVFVAAGRRVVLLDFGIGKLLEPEAGRGSGPRGEDLTELLGSALTPDYASPEQIAGKPVGTRSDLYSLGVLLYELLCGERPYRLRRHTRAALEEAILEQDVAPPSTRVQSDGATKRAVGPRALSRMLRGDLDAIVLKAMARDPARRYATAQSLGDDLRRWLRKEPVEAQPDHWTYRVRRLLARRWRSLGVAAAVTAVVLASALVALHQARVAVAQRMQAQEEARKARALVAFMQNLLTQNSLQHANPAEARKRTAEELLDDGATQIATGLADAPETRLELMATMAKMYRDLRLPAKAVQLLEEGARQADQLYAADDPRRLAAWQRVADASFNGDLGEHGLHALAQVLPHVDRLSASRDPAERMLAADILFVHLQLLALGDIPASLPVARQLARVIEGLPQRTDPALAEHWIGVEHFLGVAAMQNLQLREAERHFAASDQLRRTAIKGSERGYASHLAWHAAALDLLGRHDEAHALFARANEMERQVDEALGNINAWSANVWVQALIEAGRAREAVAVAVTGSPADGRPPATVMVATLAGLLAQAKALGRIGQAELALERLEDHAVLWTRMNLQEERRGSRERGDALIALGRLDEADTALARARKQLDANHNGRGWLSRGLHFAMLRLRLSQGDAAAARAALADARPALLPADAGPREQFAIQVVEARIELLERRPREARDRLQKALGEFAASPAAPHAREWMARAREALAQAQEALGHRDAARRLLAEVLGEYQAMFDPLRSPDVGRVADHLAVLERDAGLSGAARAHAALAQRIRAQHPTLRRWPA